MSRLAPIAASVLGVGMAAGTLGVHPEVQTLFKWWIFDFAVLPLAFLLSRATEIFVPRLSKFTVGAGLLVALGLLVHPLEQLDLHRWLPLVTLLGLCQNPARGSVAVHLATWFAVGLTSSIFAQAGWDVFAHNLSLLGARDDRWLAAAFGNVNIAAEAIAMSIPFLLEARRNALSQRSAAAWSAVAVAAVFFVAVSHCRSAQMAVAIVTLHATGVGARMMRTGWRVRAGLIALATILAIAVNIWLYGFKKHTLGLRMSFWRAALEMTIDHPLGVGHNNFLFFAPPYQTRDGVPIGEKLFAHTPHDEPLRVLAEDGILVFAGGLTFALSLVLHARRASRLLTGVAIVFAVQSLVQFPTSSAVAMALMVVALASWMGSGAVTLVPLSARASLGFRAALLMLLALAAGRTLYPQIGMAIDPTDVGTLKRACAIAPNDSSACYQLGVVEMQTKMYDECTRDANEGLARFPDYYPYLKIRAFCVAPRDLPAGCADLRTYAKHVWSESTNDVLDRVCRPSAAQGD